MNQWDIMVRYAKGSEVTKKLVDAWERDASRAVQLARGLR